MLGVILNKLIGSKNKRELKKLRFYLNKINALEMIMKSFTNQQLKDKTIKFREQLSNGASLNDIIIEAFAVVRETAFRTIGMRPFDVQVLGGLVLHEGKIAEMKTGEGKTLAATMPVYLNALPGLGVHIVTINDYLAKRDTEWMGPIYQFLGLTVSVIVNNLVDSERRSAYNSDITYGMNNEFGFDYLRDNMKFDFHDFVQRELNFAIIDEVDSILIDEARTPLIISGPSDESVEKYHKINNLILKLKPDKDYTVDEKHRNVLLSEEGICKIEKLLNISNLYEYTNINLLHYVNQSLKAHNLFKKDVDYLVIDNKIVIVDEFTGRIMPGRRYSDGLHQALEAKEHVRVEKENQTLATITFQNYFRMYNKISGMTGTADTEALEFNEIYNLEVIIIPTNKPMIRFDKQDLIYKTEREKNNAIVEEIKNLNKKFRPILVGTISIQKSEYLSKLLKKNGIKHYVLNAKNHEKEAEIITKAGQIRAVTISTNMAGRGTDIKLGKGVAELGGLHVIGTERHESRRIDNQLRGRAGRQGDNGSSQFYLSLEDDLLRIFGSQKISAIMDRIGFQENQPIRHKIISKAIENAQKRVESQNFDIRKHLLEFDNVMNKQRHIIYEQRKTILSSENIWLDLEDLLDEKIDYLLIKFTSYNEEFDFNNLNKMIYEEFLIKLNIENHEINYLSINILKEKIFKEVKHIWNNKINKINENIIQQFIKYTMLQTIDTQWKDHLFIMDHLKDGIGLRGYGQKDPIREYQKEAYEIFTDMIKSIKSDILKKVCLLSLPTIENEKEKDNYINQKIGRNDPCPCNSGIKYKKCCGT